MIGHVYRAPGKGGPSQGDSEGKGGVVVRESSPRRPPLARALWYGLAALGVTVVLVGSQARDAAGQAPDTAAARRRFWVRPVASAVLPGTGQFLGGRDRGAIYLATELYALSRYLQLRAEGRREDQRFRWLAFAVARRPFTSERRDTVFEYYEQMQRFTLSGEFDRDPGPAFAPEPDATTFNGSVWLLARRTYWSDPDAPPDPTSPAYQQALQFYLVRAVGPDFRWSWIDAPLEHQVFGQSIRRSDSAYRRAQIQLGILLANHLASAVDALVSTRLAAAVGRPAELRTHLDERGRTHARLALAF